MFFQGQSLPVSSNMVFLKMKSEALQPAISTDLGILCKSITYSCSTLGKVCEFI